MLGWDISQSRRTLADCALLSMDTFERGLNCNVTVKKNILVSLYKEGLQRPSKICSLSKKPAQQQLPRQQKQIAKVVQAIVQHTFRHATGKTKHNGTVGLFTASQEMPQQSLWQIPCATEVSTTLANHTEKEQ